jgi:hypothetical protein
MMTWRPEQLRAKEYLRERGSRLPVAEIRERVAAAFAAVEAVLDPVSEATASVRAWPGEWSVKETVDHLVESHRAAVGELRDLLQGRRPAGAPIPAGLRSPDPQSRDWGHLVQDLKACHADVLALLAGERDDDPGPARAAAVLVVTVAEADGQTRALEWIEELDWKAYAVVFRLHALDHLAQIRRALREVRAAD